MDDDKWYDEERLAKMRIALELVLQFHSGSPWTPEKQEAWANNLTMLLGVAAGRKDYPSNEATTKNLCNAVRAALK